LLKVRFLGEAFGVVGIKELTIEMDGLPLEEILKEVSKNIGKELTLVEKEGVKSVYILKVDDINLSVIVNYDGENVSNIDRLKTILKRENWF